MNTQKDQRVLLTGDGEVETYLRLINHGVFEYVLKPAGMDDLTRIVHAARACCGNTTGTAVRSDHGCNLHEAHQAHVPVLSFVGADEQSRRQLWAEYFKIHC